MVTIVKPRYDFGPVAQEYDQWYESREGRRFDRLEKSAVSRLLKPEISGPDLLEVGTGTGWWSRYFVEKGFLVTGVDISTEMVETARKKSIGGADFQQADAHELPFADDRFDVVAAITSLEFTTDPVRVLGEMTRCARPRGRLILGILNAESSLNRARMKVPGSPFAAAQLMTAAQLRTLLAPMGAVRMIPCAFPLAVKFPEPVSAWIDSLLRWSGSRDNAFLAIEVRLCKSKPN